MNIDDFYPETYNLGILHDVKEFLQSKTQGIWVIKFDNYQLNNKYRFLIRRITKIREKLYRKNIRKFYEFYGKNGVFQIFNIRKQMDIISIYHQKKSKIKKKGKKGNKKNQVVFHAKQYRIDKPSLKF